MRILLDTSVLIDALRLRRGRRKWLAELVEAGHTLQTSALNVAEVFAGMRSVEEGRTKDLLNAIDCHEISAVVAEVAGKLQNEWARKGRSLTLGDMMVAAVALEQGCPLATDNREHFPMRELELFPLPSE